MRPNLLEMGWIANVQFEFPDDGVLHVDEPALFEPSEELLEGTIDFTNGKLDLKDKLPSNGRSTGIRRLERFRTTFHVRL